MSNNLYKAGWVVVNGNTRVINTNDLVEQKVKEAAAHQAMRIQEEEALATNDDFVSGLDVDRVDALLDQEGEDALRESAAMEAQARAEQALAEANQQRKQAELDAQEMLANAEAEIEHMKYQAMEDAKQQGYQAGYEEGMTQVNAQKEEVAIKEKQLMLQYQQMIDELEPTFIEVLTGIYEHIFKVDLSSYKQLVTELVIDAMQKTETKKNYIIHCSKQDFPIVNNDKDRILEETGTTGHNVEIIADMTLAPTQCMIETDGGIYDCSLDTELEELKRKLCLLSYKK